MERPTALAVSCWRGQGVFGEKSRQSGERVRGLRQELQEGRVRDLKLLKTKTGKKQVGGQLPGLFCPGVRNLTSRRSKGGAAERRVQGKTTRRKEGGD